VAILVFYHHSGFRISKYFMSERCKIFTSYFPTSYSYSPLRGPAGATTPLFVFLCANRLASTTTEELHRCHQAGGLSPISASLHRVFKGIISAANFPAGSLASKLHATTNSGQLVVFPGPTAAMWPTATPVAI